MNNETKYKLWLKFSKELGIVVREIKNKVVDEVCDEFGATSEERAAMKCVAPITLVCGGKVTRYGG